MELYLLRHAIAHDLGEDGSKTDTERSLTREGTRRMRAAAVGMRTMGLDFGRILTSPLVRAEQTARIVGDVLRCTERIEPCEELRPGGGGERLIAGLSDETKPVLLVGHEPDLGLLASRLVWGCVGSVVAFKKGGLCRIDVIGGVGVLRWLVTPGQLRLMGGSRKQ